MPKFIIESSVVYCLCLRFSWRRKAGLKFQVLLHFCTAFDDLSNGDAGSTKDKLFSHSTPRDRNVRYLSSLHYYDVVVNQSSSSSSSSSTTLRPLTFSRTSGPCLDLLSWSHQYFPQCDPESWIILINGRVPVSSSCVLCLVCFQFAVSKTLKPAVKTFLKLIIWAGMWGEAVRPVGSWLPVVGLKNWPPPPPAYPCC